MRSPGYNYLLKMKLNLGTISIGAPGSEGNSYVKMLIANTKSIVESLGGDYEAF